MASWSRLRLPTGATLRSRLSGGWSLCWATTLAGNDNRPPGSSQPGWHDIPNLFALNLADLS